MATIEAWYRHHGEGYRREAFNQGIEIGVINDVHRREAQIIASVAIADWYENGRMKETGYKRCCCIFETCNEMQ